MKAIYILLFTLCSCVLYPQEDSQFTKPDYTLIEKNVKDKKSTYYFKTLYDRFTKADSTMTMEEKRHLYYGYSFQEEYAPYSRSDAYKELNEILQKEELSKTDYEKILVLSEAILKVYPFSIRMKEYRIFSYKELAKYEEAERETIQASIIIDAILSTGDGTSKDNSFYVINTMNEYELLNILGFEFGGEQRLVDGLYDYLTLNENSYNLKGFYFEVSRCLNSLKF